MENFKFLPCILAIFLHSQDLPPQDEVSMETVHCCYVHVCFVQVTTCGAPDVLTRLSARNFLLLSYLLGSQNKYQLESAHTEVRRERQTSFKIVTWTNQTWTKHHNTGC